MRIKAIILKKQNTNEYDQLVTCYTEEFGKMTAVAKSVLKPNSIQAMHLDDFNLVDFELINGRATPIIAGAQAERTYSNLKNNLESSAVACFFTETMDKLSFDYQKDEELWTFLVSLLENLDGRVDSKKEFFMKKQLEFLDILGYAPNLKECAFCSRPELIAYSMSARGGVCRDCFLGGREGVVVKGEDLMSGPVINGIFESLMERKIHSLNLVYSVLK